MAKRPPALWRCPKCGHRFVTRNLWHSCGRYRLADHFAEKPPVLRRTFQRWVAAARGCGPVTVYAQKTRIVIQARVRFAGAVVRRDWLDAHLWLRRRVEHPRVLRTENFGRLGYGIHFRLTKPDEIDRELVALMREAYSEAMARNAPSPSDAEQQLASFIGKFDAQDQRLIRAVRRAARRRFPTANELVWDNYNFFVIGYSPTERPSDAIISIAAKANGVGLCFIHGASLPDPKKVLQGSGNQTRFVRLESADAFSRPEVEALLAAAVARAKVPLPESGRGKLIIRSISSKQRPRRRPMK